MSHAIYGRNHTMSPATRHKRTFPALISNRQTRFRLPRTYHAEL